ncbi:MAG: N-acetylglucosamine-6-phosphate deacetylase [Nitrospinota bacterium]
MEATAGSILLRGGRVHTPQGALEGGDLLLLNGRIEACHTRLDPPPGAIVVEAKGRHVVPGFIDLQVNGGGGRAILEGTETAVRAVARSLAPLGTTTFLPTLISAPETTLLDTLCAVRSASLPDGHPAARVGGVHVEGPFLNPEMAGAHPPEHLRPPDPSLFDRIVRAWEGADGRPSAPALITLAPELSGALDLLETVSQRGWRPAFGHTKATYQEAERAVRAGVRLATHAYNRMGGFHHREPGILGLVLTDRRVTAGFIADGIHVHPAALQAGLRLKGPGGAFLVSDASPAGDEVTETGEPEGFLLGGTRIFRQRDRVVTSGGALAGAILSSRRALANVVRLCGFSLEEALPWVTETPARALGLYGRKGALAPGADADVLVLDPDLEVRWVAVGGRVALDRL